MKLPKVFSAVTRSVNKKQQDDVCDLSDTFLCNPDVETGDLTSPVELFSAEIKVPYRAPKVLSSAETATLRFCADKGALHPFYPVKC